MTSAIPRLTAVKDGQVPTWLMERLRASDAVAVITEVTKGLVAGAFGEELLVHQAGTNSTGDLVMLLSMPVQIDWLVRRAANKVAKDLKCDFGTSWLGDCYLIGFSERRKKQRRRPAEQVSSMPSGD